ncbi:hypothetical protein QG37_03661 [Candidozyma auris]|uniref:Uncharacterized protein n=1 Tax=Candidozyma auris TaxID=498019 RepID=A0A0L0NZE5_CANAR|nr:hypothetical protein QG37_03661 [[Candida] auris]
MEVKIRVWRSKGTGEEKPEAKAKSNSKQQKKSQKKKKKKRLCGEMNAKMR